MSRTRNPPEPTPACASRGRATIAAVARTGLPRIGLLAGALGASLTLCPWAHAQHEGLSVAWVAPAECPTAAQIRRQIDRLLGCPVDDLLRQPLRMRANVERVEGSGWHLALQIEPKSRGGTREVIGATCTEVAQAAAIIVAMAIDPDRPLSNAAQDGSAFGATSAEAASVQVGNAGAGREGGGSDGAGSERAVSVAAFEPVELQNESPAGPVPRRHQATMAAPIPATPPPVRPRSPVEISVAVRALGTITTGILPSTAGGGVLQGGAVLDRTALMLEAGFLGHQRTWNGPVGGVFTWTTAGLLGCYRFVDRPVWVGPCGALALDWVHAEGLGVSTPRTPDRVVFQWGGGIDAGYRLSPRWSIVAQGLLLAPLQRPRFEVAGHGVIHCPDDHGERLRAGIQLQL